MLHTFFKVALLGALTASLSLADDFLARATNGALSDNSVGVKKLTADEASKVVGGAFQSVGDCFDTFCLSFAVSQTITGTHYKDFRAIITDEEPYNTNKHIGFMSQKVWATSQLGKRFSYFTYSAIVMDRATGKMWKESSFALNHNGIVKELSWRYKSSFDKSLGGMNP